MIGALARKLFGSSNDRQVKQYQPRVDAINAKEPEIAALSDEALRARTDGCRLAAYRVALLLDEAHHHPDAAQRERAGAAVAFLTPVATPANLMVMGPAGYRFGDYWRLGLPLVVLFGVVAVFLVPVIWSF